MLQNGAGLSRDERASMQLLVDLLRAAYSQPVCAGVHRVAVARWARRHDAQPLRRIDADVRRHAPEDGPARPRVGGRGLRARGERATYVVAVVMNSQDAHRGPGQELEEAVLRYTLSQQ